MNDADEINTPESAKSDPNNLSANGNGTNPGSDSNTPISRRVLRAFVMLIVPIALLLGGYFYWQSLQGKATTDNAYIQMDRVSISSEVPGKVSMIAVKDGQYVSAGTLLFQIDPAPFELEVAAAQAAIAQAQANISALSNSSDLSGASISAAQEDIAFAKANFARKDALFKRGFLTKTELDAAHHAVAQAQEGLRLAESKRAEAQAKLAQGAAIPGVNPQIAAAMARKSQAELSLSRSVIRAPINGRITQTDRLQIGQQVIQGLPIATLVALDTAYVEANFKETDLAEMRTGQKAEITIDAYPNLRLKGHVSSIGVGTGSEFAILPAQNSSGNWVKVTQRVPVRITIDEASPRPLIAGLSTHVTVFTAKK